MNALSCGTAVPMSTLIAYWLGELDAPAESEIEEHLFACAHCTQRLQQLVQLGQGIKRAIVDGKLHAVLTVPCVTRLRDAGLTIREYRVQPGGSVMCTLAPEDDLVVAHLQASLRDVQRLDVVFQNLTAGTRERLQDVSFDPGAEEVVLMPNASELRHVAAATVRAQLVAVDDAQERVIGSYTFNHSRYDAGG